MATTEQTLHTRQQLTGLSEAEAGRRMASTGGNRIRRKSSRSYSRILGQNLFTFLNLLIISIAVALALLGQFVDALITASLALTNVSVATIQ